jgi:hypothetical protein
VAFELDGTQVRATGSGAIAVAIVEFEIARSRFRVASFLGHARAYDALLALLALGHGKDLLQASVFALALGEQHPAVARLVETPG